MKFQIRRASRDSMPIDLPGVQWEKIYYVVHDAYVNDYAEPDIKKYLAQYKITAIREIKESNGTTTYCFDYIYTEIIEVVTINHIEELMMMIEEEASSIIVQPVFLDDKYPTLLIYDDYVE